MKSQNLNHWQTTNNSNFFSEKRFVYVVKPASTPAPTPDTAPKTPDAKQKTPDQKIAALTGHNYEAQKKRYEHHVQTIDNLKDKTKAQELRKQLDQRFKTEVQDEYEPLLKQLQGHGKEDAEKIAAQQTKVESKTNKLINEISKHVPKDVMAKSKTELIISLTKKPENLKPEEKEALKKEGKKVEKGLKEEADKLAKENPKGLKGLVGIGLAIYQAYKSIMAAFKDNDLTTVQEFIEDGTNDIKGLGKVFKASQDAYKETMEAFDNSENKPSLNQLLLAHTNPRGEAANTLFSKGAPKDKQRALTRYRNEARPFIKAHIQKRLGKGITVGSIEKGNGNIAKINAFDKNGEKIAIYINPGNGNSFDVSIKKFNVTPVEEPPKSGKWVNKEKQIPYIKGQAGYKPVNGIDGLVKVIESGSFEEDKTNDKEKDQKSEDKDKNKWKEAKPEKPTNRYNAKDLEGIKNNWRKLKRMIRKVDAKADKQLIKEHYNGPNKQQKLNAARIQWIIKNLPKNENPIETQPAPKRKINKLRSAVAKVINKNPKLKGSPDYKNLQKLKGGSEWKTNRKSAQAKLDTARKEFLKKNA